MIRRIGKRWFVGMLVIGLASAVSVLYPFRALADEPMQGEKAAYETKIIMDENFFQEEGKQKNAPIMLAAGQKVEIEFENVGFEKHETMFGRGGLIYEEGKAHGYKENLFNDVTVEIKGKISGKEFEIKAAKLIEIEFDPETELTVEFSLPENKIGTWEIGCFVKDHYAKGQHSPLIVMKKQ